MHRGVEQIGAHKVETEIFRPADIPKEPSMRAGAHDSSRGHARA